MKPIFTFCIFLLLIACTSGSENENTTLDSASTELQPMTATGDNSRVSLDWPGTYNGILPCADCAGIYTSIRLMEDGRYTMLTNYLGKNEEALRDSGSFEWDQSGGIITLASADSKYRVGENVLIQLDKEGNPITSALANHYRLSRQGQQITGQYWRLIQVRGEDIPPPQSGQRVPHLLLMPDTARVTGFSGCNNFFGAYELDGLRLSFSKIAGTMMACPDVEYEQSFLQALENTDNYTTNATGDTLSLNRARMAPLAILVADTPD